MANYSKPFAREVELADILYNKLNCAIRCALRDGIPISFDCGYRATINRNTHLWDYRRDRHGQIVRLFIVDLLLLGRKPILGNSNDDIARFMTLKVEYITSFEFGVIGCSYRDIRYPNEAHSAFYRAGDNIRIKYFNSAR